MRAAIVVIDMVRDNFAAEHPITAQALSIVPRINEITAWARAGDLPVVFACDSFLPDDFIFHGRMKPHSLRGTPGAEVCDEVTRLPGDVFLPKRRFSAFFKTDLDQSLRTWGVDTVALCGIATQFCVLATAMDALSLDFSCIIVEDACAAFSEEVHERTLDLYRKNPLYPLFRIMPAQEFFRLADRAGG